MSYLIVILKSNMDRFIVYPLLNISGKATFLKSNMDRFIVIETIKKLIT